MALTHARELEVINVRPLGQALAGTPTQSLLKRPGLQLMRLVLARGQHVAEHQVAGAIIVQVLEGSLTLSTPGATLAMATGELAVLPGGEPHALDATADASLLVTLLGTP